MQMINFYHRVAFLCVVMTILGLANAQYLAYLADNRNGPAFLTTASLAKTMPAANIIPSPTKWPRALAHLAQCGAPRPSSGTRSPCPYVPDSSLINGEAPLVPPRQNRTDPLSMVPEYIKAWYTDPTFQDIIGFQYFLSRQPQEMRILTSSLLFECEQFYVQWIVNQTGKYPPPKSDYDPRCVCDDAIHFFFEFYNSRVSPSNTGSDYFTWPKSHIYVQWRADNASDVWDWRAFPQSLNWTRWAAGTLTGYAFHLYNMDEARYNRSDILIKDFYRRQFPNVPPLPPFLRYTAERIDCREKAIVRPTESDPTNLRLTTDFRGIFHPSGSRRSAHDYCTESSNNGGRGFVVGSAEYVTCVQDETWSWFWSIPPSGILLSSRPSEYALLTLFNEPAGGGALTPTSGGALTPAARVANNPVAGSIHSFKASLYIIAMALFLCFI